MSAGELLIFLAWLASVFFGCVGIEFWVRPHVPRWMLYSLLLLFFMAIGASLFAVMNLLDAPPARQGTVAGFIVAGTLAGLFGGVVVAVLYERDFAKERQRREQR